MKSHSRTRNARQWLITAALVFAVWPRTALGGA